MKSSVCGGLTTGRGIVAECNGKREGDLLNVEVLNDLREVKVLI